MKKFVCLTLVGFLATTASAAIGAETPSPYAGWENREIKGLSKDQIRGLLAGNGMSMALPAELNHYPGPRHTLELAPKLGLAPGQIEAVRALETQMTKEAISLGKEIITQEAILDTAFGTGVVSVAALEKSTAMTARLRGQLRFTHLKYHLKVRDLLSAEQIARYDSFRGYNDLNKRGGQGHQGMAGHGK